MKFRIFILIISNLFLSMQLLAQNQLDVLEIIKKTEIQTNFYKETFQNLISVETKTCESFNKNGSVKKKNIVVANFLVYKSSKNNKLSFELRDVITVDNKPIKRDEGNSDSFFSELSKTTTQKSELDKIQKASSKYDRSLDVSGLTLYEGIILSENLRPFFEFKMVGKDVFEGKEVYVISYQQIKNSPFIFINRKNVDFNTPGLEFDLEIPKELRLKDVFLKGRFWVDVNNFQIWREERELLIQTLEPLTIIKTDLIYQSSNYEILVPKLITLFSNQIKKKDGVFKAVPETKITFEYSKFRKTETDVKILDDTEN